MSAVLEVGYLLKGRYLVQQVLKSGERDRAYLARDELRAGETCLVWEFIARNTEEAARIAATFASQLDRLKTCPHFQIQQLKEYWWQGEHLFFVQSYIEGPTARDRGPGTASFNEGEILQLLQQILPVLNALNAQQIVHGDVSPDNLQWSSANNLPVLTHFGVFREIKTQLGIDPFEKKFSDRLRELPLHFPPTEPSEDLYAIAVTAIMLLTGQEIGVLFNPQTQTWDWEDYKLVSDRLADALNRMLSPQASDRFPSAAAMLQALNAPVAPPSPVFMPPPPPPPPTYTPPTLISAPPAATAAAFVAPSFPTSGLKDWQKAAIAGGMIGAFVLGAMLLLRPSIWQQQGVNEVRSEETEESLISPSITREEAVTLIKKWQSAKKEIFASPFNRQLGAEVLTGKAYSDNIGSSENSVDWLQNNNAYYTYGIQRLDSVEAFEVEGEQATIDVVITEQRTFYKNNKVVNDDNTAFDTRLVRYTLQFDNEQWKIADYNTVRVLETR